MPQFKAGARESGEHLKSHKAIHDGTSSSLFLFCIFIETAWADGIRRDVLMNDNRDRNLRLTPPQIRLGPEHILRFGAPGEHGQLERSALQASG